MSHLFSYSSDTIQEMHEDKCDLVLCVSALLYFLLWMLVITSHLSSFISLMNENKCDPGAVCICNA